MFYSLEVGYGLIPLVDETQEGDLLERIRAIRQAVCHGHGHDYPAPACAR